VPSETPAPSLLLRVRSRLCALPLEHVIETMRPRPVSAVVNTSPWVTGLSIIRGAAVPVVDVARLLDPSVGDAGVSDPNGAARFVTVRTGDRTVALAVDAVVGVRNLPASALGELPPLLRDVRPDAVAAIGTLDAELLVVLCTAHLVPGDPSVVTNTGATE
jgi:purine-binding chemotaxis protein CheW